MGNCLNFSRGRIKRSTKFVIDWSLLLRPSSASPFPSLGRDSLPTPPDGWSETRAWGAGRRRRLRGGCGIRDQGMNTTLQPGTKGGDERSIILACQTDHVIASKNMQTNIMGFFLFVVACSPRVVVRVERVLSHSLNSVGAS